MSTTTTHSRASLIARTALTPIERAHGRFLRAPDHDAGTPGAAPAGEAAPAAEADPLSGGTILGEQPAAEAAAAAPAEGEKPAEGEAAKEGEGAKAEGDQPTGAPETYELALPDGVTLDEGAWALAEPVVRELGLSNEQASKLAAIYPQLAQSSQEAASAAIIGEVVEQRKAWATETQNDPTYGGAQYEASKVHAARFIDTFGRTAQGADGKTVNVLRQVMDETGLGNHPALFAAFAKAGADLAEDTPPRGNPPANEPKTLGEKYFGASG